MQVVLQEVKREKCHQQIYRVQIQSFRIDHVELMQS